MDRTGKGQSLSASVGACMKVTAHVITCVNVVSGVETISILSSSSLLYRTRLRSISVAEKHTLACSTHTTMPSASTSSNLESTSAIVS